jgi:tetratricopeptide (TPR) repeat protein
MRGRRLLSGAPFERFGRIAIVILLAGAGCSFHGSFGPREKRDAAVERGFRHVGKGEWSYAMGAFHEALDIDSASAPAHYGLGRVYTETGFLDGAERELLRATEIRPDYGEAYLGLAALYDRLGRADEAEKNIREAERCGATHSPQGLFLTGIFADRAGDVAEAEEKFREGLRLAPADDALRLALIDLLLAQQRFDEALGELERERFPRGREEDVRVRLAACRLHLGQDLEAERLYRQIAASNPASRDAVEGLLLLSMRRGDVKAASEHFRELAVLVPEGEAEAVGSLASSLEGSDPFGSLLVRCRELRPGAGTGFARLLDRWIRELGEKSR